MKDRQEPEFFPVEIHPGYERYYKFYGTTGTDESGETTYELVDVYGGRFDFTIDEILPKHQHHLTMT